MEIVGGGEIVELGAILGRELLLADREWRYAHDVHSSNEWVKELRKRSRLESAVPIGPDAPASTNEHFILRCGSFACADWRKEHFRHAGRH